MEMIKTMPGERDLAHDKHSFLEAVSSGTVRELPISFDHNAVQELAARIQHNKVFLLGETHGVKQNVDVIYTLFKRFGFRQLALEWNSSLTPVAETYLETGNLDFAAIQESPDGRITAGHFALLKKLMSEGALEKLICFDGDAGWDGWSARDATMARNILSNLSDAPTLVVAGNLHTKTEPVTFADEPTPQHPMGERLKQELPSLASGRIVYRSGQYHNFGTKKFAPVVDDETPATGRFFKREDGLYILEVIDAQPASVPNPSKELPVS